MLSLKDIKAVITTLFLIFLSCESTSNRSNLNTVAYQPDAQEMAFIISITGHGEGMIEYVTNSVDLPPIIKRNEFEPRLHFPDNIEKIVPKAGVHFDVKLCNPNDHTQNLELCFRDDFQTDYFVNKDGSSIDPTMVSQAIVEAVILLTLSDKVPECYRAYLEETEKFENNINSDTSGGRFHEARNHLEFLTQSFNICKNIARNEWNRIDECGFLAERQNILQETFRKAVLGNPSIEKAYRNRYKLALRLGIDELQNILRDGESNGQGWEISPYPSSLNDYYKHHGCTEYLDLGDKDCLFGSSFTDSIQKNLALNHFNMFISNSQNIQFLLEPQEKKVLAEGEGVSEGIKRYNFNNQPEVAKLLLQAVKLAKASFLGEDSLSPKEYLQKYHQKLEESITCEQVADFQLGQDTIRHEAIKKIMNPDSPSAARKDLHVSKAVIGSQHICSLTEGVEIDESIRGKNISCWGLNSKGQLGIGSFKTVKTSHSGEEIFGSFKDVAAGDHHSCALDQSGLVYCWGSSGFGENGQDKQTYAIERNDKGDLEPTFGKNKLPPMKAIDAGKNTSCAVSKKGSVYCWGYGFYTHKSGFSKGDKDPQEIIQSSWGNIEAISVGDNHVCAINFEKELWCWGQNRWGEVGNDKIGASVFWPEKITLQSDLGGELVASVSTGTDHTCAITTRGKLFCWGSNRRFQLGIPEAVLYKKKPFQVDLKESGEASALAITSVSAGAAMTCAIADNDGVYCWGDIRKKIFRNGAGENEGTSKAFKIPTAMDFSLPQDVRPQSVVVGSRTACVIGAKKKDVSKKVANKKIYCIGSPSR